MNYLEWEFLTDTFKPQTGLARIPVPGGWVYMAHDPLLRQASICFVPKPPIDDPMPKQAETA